MFSRRRPWLHYDEAKDLVYKCDHEIILMVDTRDIHTNLLMDKLCMDVISIPVKNYNIASIGILNCELL